MKSKLCVDLGGSFSEFRSIEECVWFSGAAFTFKSWAKFVWLTRTLRLGREIRKLQKSYPQKSVLLWNSFKNYRLKTVWSEESISKSSNASLTSLSDRVTEQVLSSIVNSRQQGRKHVLITLAQVLHDIPARDSQHISIFNGDVWIRTPIADKIEVTGAKACSSGLVVADDVFLELRK
jgi:hypothetical protein